MEYSLDTTIEQLYENKVISKIFLRSFCERGMNTLRDIQEQTNDLNDLYELNGFNFKMLKALTKVFEQVMKDEKTPVPLKVVDFESIIQMAYHTSLSSVTKINPIFRSVYPSPNRLHAAVMEKGYEMFEILPALSISQNLKFRGVVYKFVSIVIARLMACPAKYETILQKYKEKQWILSRIRRQLACWDLAAPFLHPTLKECLQFLPDEDVTTGTMQGQKRHHAIPPRTEESSLSADEKDERSERKWLLQQSTRFLKKKQRAFPIVFFDQYGYEPLFYLLRHYLPVSKRKVDRVYALKYGLTDGQTRSVQELCKTLRIRRQSALRFLNTRTLGVQESGLLAHLANRYYQDLFGLPYIVEQTPQYVELKEREQLDLSFAMFTSILQMIGPFSVVDVEGVTIAVNNSNVTAAHILRSIANLKRVTSLKYDADTLIPLDSVIACHQEPALGHARVIMRYVAREVMKLNLNENDELLCAQTFVCRAKEVRQILEQRGEPMTLDEIFEAFKKRCPDKYQTAEEMRRPLSLIPGIRSIGRPARYGFKKWKQYFFGSRKQLVISLLEDSDEPIHAQILLDRVVEYFPQTNLKYFTLLLDKREKRFVGFHGDYIGLKGKKYPRKYRKKVRREVEFTSFDDFFTMFRDFVEKNHRYPDSNRKDEQERKLDRWIYRARNGKLQTTDEERARLAAAFQADEERLIPRNRIEMLFRDRCIDYENFVKLHHKLPNKKEGRNLYGLFKESEKSNVNYFSSADYRQRYLAALSERLEKLTIYTKAKQSAKPEKMKVVSPPFEKGLKRLCDFVKKHKRYPWYKGKEYNIRIWLYKIAKGQNQTTTEQMAILTAKLKTFEENLIPRNKYELLFRNNCVDYENFVKTNHKHPTSTDSKRLHLWYKATMRAYNYGIDDYRQRCMEKLFETLKLLGLSL